MRSASVFCWLLSIGTVTAQQAPPPIIRSIQFRPIQTASRPLPSIGPDVITAAIQAKGIDLALERRLDPEALQKAAGAVRDLYNARGQKVRVEFRVNQIPPRSVQIAFEIIQLCSCE